MQRAGSEFSGKSPNFCKGETPWAWLPGQWAAQGSRKPGDFMHLASLSGHRFCSLANDKGNGQRMGSRTGGNLLESSVCVCELCTGFQGQTQSMGVN